MTDTKPKWDYPTPIRKEIGCKVSWYTYDNLDDAKKASEIAKEEAIESAAMGFDFGYCYPSEIKEQEDGTFTVTLP